MQNRNARVSVLSLTLVTRLHSFPSQWWACDISPQVLRSSLAHADNLAQLLAQVDWKNVVITLFSQTKHFCQGEQINKTRRINVYGLIHLCFSERKENCCTIISTRVCMCVRWLPRYPWVADVGSRGLRPSISSFNGLCNDISPTLINH